MPRPKGSKNKNPAQGRIKLYENTTISGTPEEISALKKLAEEKGISLSRLIIETLLNKAD